MTKVTLLAHERLIEVLDYDPATGVFAWKIQASNRVKRGQRAGVVGTNGYRLINIDGVKMQATRLAWFYVNGVWPDGDIVPLNGQRDDVRISNLVDRHRAIGARERGVISTNTSGFRGVSRSATPGRWQAKIVWDGKQVNLGNKFIAPEEASEIYEEAAKRLLDVASAADFDAAMGQLTLWRRQRAAWREIERSHSGHAWASFEQFCEVVKEVPRKRWSMTPADALRPIGPDNFRWSLPPEVEVASQTQEYRKLRNSANKEHIRSRQMQRDYGIDAATYAKMLLEQKGVCACCGKPETKIERGTVRQLSVDHDHKTGAVRGLTCNSCNLLIGYAQDDIPTLQRAIAYLRRYDPVTVKFEPSVINGALSSGG